MTSKIRGRISNPSPFSDPGTDFKSVPVYLVLLWLLLGALVVPAAAGEMTPLEVARRLQQTYDRTIAFRAEFTQVTTVPMSNRRREGSGTVIFRKPHLMRWEYLRPDRQVLVSDGKRVRLYFAGSNQMMIRPVDEYLESDVTYAFFSGSGEIVRDFEVSEALAEFRHPDYHVIKLVPRTLHPQVDYLYLWVDREKFFMQRLEIIDQFGSATILAFARVEIDPVLPPDFHHFEPPPGTEIIGP